MLQKFTALDNAYGTDVTVLGRTMTFPGVSADQLERARLTYDDGALVQEAFGFLTTSQREFLMTGLMDGEFEDLFPEED